MIAPNIMRIMLYDNKLLTGLLRGSSMLNVELKKEL